jgi:hypothetical protein
MAYPESAPPFRQIVHGAPRLSRKSLIWALVQAILLAILLRAVTIVNFERLTFKATAILPSAEGFSATLSAGPEPAGREGLRILSLQIRGRGKTPRSAAVSVNGVGLDEIRFGSRARQGIFLEVPESVPWRAVNDIVISGGDGSWTVKEIRLQNYFGFASGLFNLILLPKSATIPGRLPWPGLGALFLALWLLEIVRAGTPQAPRIARAHRIIKTISVALLLAAAGLPFVTQLRLFTRPDRLWLFVLLLSFAGTAALGKAFFRWAQTELGVQALDANPARKRIVSLAIPALIGLFFLSCMFGIKRQLGGGYSSFLRIEKARLAAFAPLYFPPDRAAEIRAGLVPRDGYDGQFSYFMAFDPFLSKYKDAPLTYNLFIDEPAYRFGRIGLPLLVKLASWNDPRLFPRTIVWLIVLSHFFGAFFLLKIILHFKKNPFWTLLYVLVPGFYYSLQWGLGESIALALVLAGFLGYLEGRLLPALAALAASLFFRESGLMVILAIALLETFRKRGLKKAVFIGGAVIPYLLWKGFLTYRLFAVNGWKTLFLGPADFTAPFSGILELFRHIRIGDYDQVYVGTAGTAAVYACLLIGLFVIAVALFFKSRNAGSLSLLLFSAVSVSFNYAMVWIYVGGAIRLTTEAFVFLIPAYLMQKDALPASWKRLAVGFFVLLYVFDFFIMDISGYFRSAFLFW